MSWDETLGELAARLDVLERALADGDWDPSDVAPFAPPRVTGDMTPEQRGRAAALLERLARSQQRIAEEMATAQSELADLEARRRGARSYASSDV